MQKYHPTNEAGLQIANKTVTFASKSYIFAEIAIGDNINLNVMIKIMWLFTGMFCDE